LELFQRSDFSDQTLDIKPAAMGLTTSTPYIQDACCEQRPRDARNEIHERGIPRRNYRENWQEFASDIENSKVSRTTSRAEAGDVSEQTMSESDLKRRSLLIAAEIGDTEFVSHLIKSGDCSVHDRDELGRTALHLAAANGHIHTSDLLLSLGADLWAYDKENKTPMMLAAMNNRDDMVFNLEKRCMTPRGQRYAANHEMSGQYTAFSPAKSDSGRSDGVNKPATSDSREDSHNSHRYQNAWQSVYQVTEVETVREVDVTLPKKFDEGRFPLRLKCAIGPTSSQDVHELQHQHVVTYIDPSVLMEGEVKVGDALLKIGQISLQGQSNAMATQLLRAQAGKRVRLVVLERQQHRTNTFTF